MGFSDMSTQRMKQSMLFIFALVFSFGIQAAVIKNTAPSGLSAQPSPITKALNQQKRLNKTLSPRDDQLRVMTSLKTAPTQNFLADQHLRFSRLIQSIFTSQDS